MNLSDLEPTWTKIADRRHAGRLCVTTRCDCLWHRDAWLTVFHVSCTTVLVRGEKACRNFSQISRETRRVGRNTINGQAGRAPSNAGAPSAYHEGEVPRSDGQVGPT